jgi:hypothetical protein
VATLFQYLYSKALTINTSATGANVASNLVDFPICVVVNSSSWADATERDHFFDASNTDGKRVQFFDGDGTTNLSYEVESYDAGGESAIYWVKVPQVDGNSTTDHIHVAYGSDPNGAAQDSIAATWNSDYTAVWHLGGNSWGASPEAKDSVGTYHGVSYDTLDSAGMVGRGRTFKGWASYIGLPSFPMNLSAYTIEFMLDTKPTNKVCYWWDRSDFYDAWGHFAIVQEGGYLKICHKNTAGGVTTANVCAYASLANGQRWTFSFYKSGNAYCQPYLDGAPYGSALSFGAESWGDEGGAGDVTAIGRAGDYNGYYFDGAFSDIRHSSVARAADWEKASFFSMDATSWNGDGWLTWGAEQRPGAPVYYYQNQ